MNSIKSEAIAAISLSSGNPKEELREEPKAIFPTDEAHKSEHSGTSPTSFLHHHLNESHTEIPIMFDK